MDCQSVRRQAGEAIDRSLSHEAAAEFEEHLRRCPPCRREITLEKLSKFLVRQHVQWLETPHSTHSTILLALRREYQSTAAAAPLSQRWFFPRRMLVPTLSGSVAAVFFFSLVTTRIDSTYPMTAHTASNDIINQSFRNFALLKSGRLKPHLVSSAPENVHEYLERSNLQFGVQMLSIRNCDWCGGSATERSGVRQAHLVYKIGNELVYVLEVSDDDALYGRQVSLPPAAKRALAQSGWYTDPDHPDCNVVLWKTDEAVCVAVSTMGKGQLLSLLTSR